LHCKNAEDVLFHDVADKEKWTSVLKPQPAKGWDMTTEYCGWMHVPSVYIVADDDQVIPKAVQEHFASVANSEVKHITTGHMVSLSKPEVLAEMIKESI
jgi:pimeloyl-ACP methyl ester carboxylesterase